MSPLNGNAKVLTPRLPVQPEASTSYLAPPPSGRAHPVAAVRRSPVPPKPVLCKFFNTEKGCSGKCRFVHEAPGSVGPPNAGINARTKADRVRELERCESGRPASPPPRPPPTKVVQPSPTCKFWRRGYCTKATDCKFPHPQPSASTALDSIVAGKVDPIADEPPDTACSVCFDSSPDYYGLLESCSHVFCLTCIRSWRDSKKKEAQANLKTCPLCRGKSDFIVPSSRFAPDGEDKRAIFRNYKDTLKSKPCWYFTQSRPTHRFCPFGDDCFYAHLLPSGETFLFRKTVKVAMARHKARRGSRGGDGLFGMRVPPGGIGGPHGLDWFLNSMEHALIASQRAEPGAPSTASLFSTMGRVLGLGEGSALDAASLIAGLPPLTQINGRPAAGVRMAAPSRRRETDDPDPLSSDDEMPSLLPTNARRSRPTYVHPESDDSEEEGMPALVPISPSSGNAVPRLRAPLNQSRSRARPATAGGESSDGSLPELIPVSAAPQPARPSSSQSMIPPPAPRTRSVAAASAAAAAIARAARPAHREEPASSESDSDGDMPALVVPRSRQSSAPARALAPAAAPEADSDSDSDAVPSLVLLRSGQP